MAPLEVRDPRLHDLIAPDAPIDRIAGGLGFTEGPLWRGDGATPGCSLGEWSRTDRDDERLEDRRKCSLPPCERSGDALASGKGSGVRRRMAAEASGERRQIRLRTD